MEKYFRTRKAWRSWLEKNHSSSEGIWLIYYKKASGKQGIEYNDAVEEAVCFGWIDSKLKKVNDDYYIQWYSPRRRRSLWSKYNIERAKKMIDADLMRPSGLIEYQRALENPDIIYENSMDGDPEIPEQLLKALMDNETAYRNFIMFPASVRRMYIYWFKSAKREITRTNRIAKIIDSAAKNIRPGML